MAKQKKQSILEQMICAGAVRTIKKKSDRTAFSWFHLSMINFLTVFGSLGGFLSAFSISYSIGITMLILFSVACILSYMYQERRMKNIGYGLFFLVFFTSTIRWRIYINSGFYQIVNQMYEAFSDYFQLAGYDSYRVQMNNSYITVTSCIIFLGIIEMLFLNMLLVERRSFLGTLLYGLPLLFIPMYVHKEPSLFYLFCIVCAFLLSAITKWSPGKGKSKAYYQIMALVMAGVLLAFPIINLFFSKSKYDEGLVADSDWKSSTMESVSYFAAFGLSGFFDTYAATGGISGGKLGGVYAVRPDYETDLTVTFVPYSYRSLYLRAYMGNHYTGNSWENTLPAQDDELRKTLDTGTQAESEFLEQRYNQGEEPSAISRITIKNEDAESDYGYYPYYTKNGTGEEFFPKGQTKDYLFFPYLDTQKIKGSFSLTKEEQELYLEIPEQQKEMLSRVAKEAGLRQGMDSQEAALKLYQYFFANFEYTMRPGRTPQNRDYVEYFLTHQKKGYCAHFASAATLIFRTIGIPARYIEGYSLGYTDLENATLVSEETTEYYQGDSLLEETGVVKAEINDSMAHAWVEIFDEQLGWQVADETIPSEETEEEASSFWDMVSSFFASQSMQNDGNYSNDTDTDEQFNLNDTQGITGILLFFVGAVLFWIAFCLLFGIIKRRWSFYHYGTLAGAKHCYQDLKKIALLSDVNFPVRGRILEQTQYFYQTYLTEEARLSPEEFSMGLMQILYAKEPPENERVMELFNGLLLLRKQAVKKLRFSKKLTYYLTLSFKFHLPPFFHRLKERLSFFRS